MAPKEQAKDPAAVSLGRRGGLRGGKARGTAAACEGVEIGFGEMVGCSHMSGP
jgi:hypothetical protein